MVQRASLNHRPDLSVFEATRTWLGLSRGAEIGSCAAGVDWVVGGADVRIDRDSTY